MPQDSKNQILSIRNRRKEYRGDIIESIPKIKTPKKIKQASILDPFHAT